jgi:hypothetical protein
MNILALLRSFHPKNSIRTRTFSLITITPHGPLPEATLQIYSGTFLLSYQGDIIKASRQS